MGKPTPLIVQFTQPESSWARIWTRAVWVQRLSLDRYTMQVRMWMEKAVRTFKNIHWQSSTNLTTVKLWTFHLRFSKSSSSFVSLTRPLRSWISTLRETSRLSELPALGLYQRRDLVLKLSLALSISPPFQVIRNKRSVHRLNTGCFCSASTNTYTCWM